MRVKDAVPGWVFSGAVLFLFFFGLAQIPLWSSDEGRFGEIVREMWVSKDFIVPHFNFIPHIEKPVFSFWLGSLSAALFGVSSFSMRLPSVVSALLGILMVHYFTQGLFNKKTADFAAIILATSLGYVLVGRFAIIDMVMTFFMSGAIFCLAKASIEENPRFYLFAYVFMGLSLITKGLIGLVLPALIFLFYLLWTGNLAEIKKMRLGWGVVIIALIFIPWGIAISMRQPEFSYSFIMEQHFNRYASGFFGRKRPFWFFAPILLSLAFPWSFFLPAAAFQRFSLTDTKRNKVLKFLICWFVVIFVFFSIPKSKLPYYILPLCVPLAVWVASWLDKELDSKTYRLILQGTGLVFFSALIAANFYLVFWLKDARVLPLKNLLHVASLCVFAGGWLTGFFLNKKEHAKSFISAAGTVYVLLIFIIIAMKGVTPYLSTYEAAGTLQRVMKEGDEVAMFSSPDHFSDFPFHLAKRVIVVGSDRGTLSKELQGSEYADDVSYWFPTASEFVRRFNSRSERLFCLSDEEDMKQLEHIGLVSYKVVQKGGGKLLISNEI